MKIITINKKALHDYEIYEKLEAGIVLTGDEVKSLRQGNVSLKEAFATIHEGEVTLLNAYIAPYSHAYLKDKDTSRRTRKLLLHKREINKLIGTISKKGLTLIPIKMYFKRGHVKIEIGLAKHKKAHSKKRALREKDIKRETEREIKYRR
jgi:SsrA-binding protein